MRLISDLLMIIVHLFLVLVHLAYAGVMLIVALGWTAVYLVRLLSPPSIPRVAPQRLVMAPQRPIEADEPPTWTTLPRGYLEAATSRQGSLRRQRASQGMTRGRMGLWP